MNIQDVNGDGVALDGFDPVAQYNNEPLRGKSELTLQIGDLTYQFANEANMEKFRETPGEYITMPGGFTGKPMVGDLNATSKDGKFIGNKSYVGRRGLEDTPVSRENNVPIDIKEDGNVEMQNLSDDNN